MIDYEYEPGFEELVEMDPLLYVMNCLKAIAPIADAAHECRLSGGSSVEILQRNPYNNIIKSRQKEKGGGNERL